MEAPERRPAEGLGEMGTRDREPWSRDGSRKRDGDGGEAADTERHRNKRGRGESRKGGRRGVGIMNKKRDCHFSFDVKESARFTRKDGRETI